MPILIGFEPSIKLELRFSGLELLHLYYGAAMHYDGACKAAIKDADSQYGTKNGILVIARMRLESQIRRNEFDNYLDYDAPESHAAFLLENLDAEIDLCLEWREVDLLCKISEQFNLIATMRVPPERFCKTVATNIMRSLHQSLQAASEHIAMLSQQETERRASVDKH